MKKNIFVLLFTIGSFLMINNVKAECPIVEKYYNITFVTNVGPEIDNETICKECDDLNDFMLPSLEYQENGIFYGWYADKELTQRIFDIEDFYKLNTQEVKNNEGCYTGEIKTTLYAKWERLDCPIRDGGTETISKFDTDGGKKIEMFTICNTCADYQEQIKQALPKAEKEGYKFLGWFANKDYTTEIKSLEDENIIFNNVYNNKCNTGSVETTLYAKFEKETNSNSVVNDDNTSNKINKIGNIVAYAIIVIIILFIVIKEIMNNNK